MLMFPDSYRRYKVLKESTSKIDTEGHKQVFNYIVTFLRFQIM